jgi:hypothetical protein
MQREHDLAKLDTERRTARAHRDTTVAAMPLDSQLHGRENGRMSNSKTSVIKLARAACTKQASASTKSVAPKKSAKGPKTQPTLESVQTFLSALDDATRADCLQVDRWMSKAAGPGTMYGKAIVGYGSKLIRYADGREAPWMKMGFAPRKRALTLYGLLTTATETLLATLGKHTCGKGCIYVQHLADIDARVLEKLIVLAARG